MAKYKVVMLSYNFNDMIVKSNMTLEEAQQVLKECEECDSFHYYEIKEMN